MILQDIIHIYFKKIDILLIYIDNIIIMTLFLNNKFNIIHNIDKEIDYDYKSQVINFVENYLESEISIVHPDYLYQICVNNTYENMDNQILVIFKNHLKKLKVNVKNAIKRDDFSIEKGLNKLIQNYIHKISYLNNIFRINKSEYYNLFHNTIISDQIIINFIENELSCLSNNINSEIKTLINNIKIINQYNTENYIWFLKLVGIIIKNNIPEIKEMISIKQLYEIKLITNYISSIKSTYSFIKEDTEHIIEPIIEIYMDKIKTFITTENNFDDFYIFIEFFWKNIRSVLSFGENINTIKNDIAIKIQKRVKQISDNNDDSFKIIKLIILLNDYKIAENQLFLLFNNEKINKNIIKFINNNINNNIELLNRLFLLLGNLKEKDVFIQKYHNELIKRLLSTKTSINAEKILYNTLVKVFGEKEVKKINKCINDYIDSSKYLIMVGPQSFTTTMITTSYDSWNINYNNGFLDKFDYEINYSNGLLNFIENYNEFYKKVINDKKKILWLLQYGEVEVEYNNYILKMLPIQLLVLELFNSNDNMNIKDILTNKLLSNYQSDYLNDIIKSLVISGLLNNNNNILSLSTNVNNINLINSYYNCNNGINTEDILISVDELIIHSRKDITCTWINHLLKKGDKTFDELFNFISCEIKLFPLDKIILQDAIDYMLKLDYIRKSNDQYIKIYY